ncbi:unnamed protein product [Chondrus crispus]|uniref:Uncharacterized protein n=1 Tax=Chondrus crispus TaxID=2769 RepID=R7QNC2_CHOCR|nr:unnamed protein product [Chondrus crispus]CDF39288.1 unnamed protein product [Chondrus crispus]|eukprot:XP_005719199.1 unnamed protein product [Chondrus crispus]
MCCVFLFPGRRCSSSVMRAFFFFFFLGGGRFAARCVLACSSGANSRQKMCAV